MSNVLLPLFVREPELRRFILRARDHSRISDRDGNLANASQRYGDQSLANLTPGPLGAVRSRLSRFVSFMGIEDAAEYFFDGRGSEAM